MQLRRMVLIHYRHYNLTANIGKNKETVDTYRGAGVHLETSRWYSLAVNMCCCTTKTGGRTYTNMN